MATEVSEMNDEELRAHLHGETAKLPWADLEKHFARGVLFKVEKSTDILDVAIIICRDDKTSLEKLINVKKVIGVDVDDAQKWHDTQSSLWTVVVMPWVLVQEFDQKLDS